jgi:hypothetical protein
MQGSADREKLPIPSFPVIIITFAGVVWPGLPMKHDFLRAPAVAEPEPTTRGGQIE